MHNFFDESFVKKRRLQRVADSDPIFGQVLIFAIFVVTIQRKYIAAEGVHPSETGQCVTEFGFCGLCGVMSLVIGTLL